MLSTTPFRELQKIYKTLLYTLIGSLVLGFLSIQFDFINPAVTMSMDRLLQVIAVVYSFIAVIVGIQLFRRRVEAIKIEEAPVREKLRQYKSASLVQWWLLVSAGIFNVVCYCVTGNWSFLGLAIMLLAIYGGLNPFRQKVILQLRLQETELTGL